MKCKEINKIIEQKYGKKYALSWDNVGLQIGRSDKEVKRIFVALDLTDEIIEEAIEWGADMIATHHPMIFKPLKNITDQDFIGRRVLQLIQHDICYYAMHTNYDVIKMAELAGDKLGMKEAEILEVTYSDEEMTAGIGRIADLDEKMSLKDCCEWVKEVFGLPNVKVFGDPDKMIGRIAISPGSGKSMIKASLDKKVDVLITGDIDHHEGIDAVAQGMMIIDAGHYGIEHIYIEDMKGFFEENLQGVEVKTAKILQPFWII